MAQQLRGKLFMMRPGGDDDAGIAAANSFMKKAGDRVEQEGITLVKLYGMPAGATDASILKRSQSHTFFR